MAATVAREELLTLLDDYHSYNPGSAPLLPYPTPLEFCKQVSKGLPCVYSVFDPNSSDERTPRSVSSSTHHAGCDGGSQSPAHWWPALHWTRESLIQSVVEKVEVAVTPDGRADSLCSFGNGGENIFLQPATVEMSVSELLDKLCAGPGNQDSETTSPAYYLQSQNSNLTSTPLKPLMGDLPANFGFAEAVLGSPDALNIWIGNGRSVTSTHRDPYENLYLVLKGSKTFTLWAPVDEVAMDSQIVHTGHYTYNASSDPPSFTVVPDDATPESPSTIPWVPIDPQLPRPQLNKLHPLYRHAQPQSLTVHKGQMLYLPAGWFHHVAQECGAWSDGTEAPCIAVNYWFDQDYEGEKYVMRQHISRLSEIVRLG